MIKRWSILLRKSWPRLDNFNGPTETENLGLYATPYIPPLSRHGCASARSPLLRRIAARACRHAPRRLAAQSVNSRNVGASEARSFEKV
jgi:hypothetical protein